jgi:hypothetical protein
VHEIGAADDTDEPAAAYDRYPFDAVPFEELGDLFERSVVIDSNDLAGHHVARAAAVGLDVINRPPLRKEKQGQPPRRLALGLRFSPSHEIAFADDPDDSSIGFDDW